MIFISLVLITALLVDCYGRKALLRYLRVLEGKGKEE